MFLLIYSDLLVKLASGNSSDSVPLNTIGSSLSILLLLLYQAVYLNIQNKIIKQDIV